MKKKILYTSLIFLTGFLLAVSGQSVERSSGVKKLNLKKKTEVPEETNSNMDNNQPSNRSNEASRKVSISMQQSQPVQPINGDESEAFTWISPVFTSVKTAENVFEIQTTVNADENIRFINLFNNGQFVRNIIPPVNTIKQMVVEEPMELHLGANKLKVEVVTLSGKKLESSVEVVYDISSARYIALVIAVEEYDDPQINDLNEPVNDATRFTQIIHDEYNFERENIIFMRNPTKAEIIGKLTELRKIITPEDNLLIYYAGHGYWDEEMSTGYWLPRDANKSNPVNWMPNTDLTNYLNVLKSKHTLLIADACFSGGIFKSRAAFNNVLSVEKMYRLTSRKAITSGALNEVPDKSVFIEYLIKRLDSNRNKYLPSEELYASMKEAIMNNSNNEPLYGTIQNVGDEGGDFIFIRRD